MAKKIDKKLQKTNKRINTVTLIFSVLIFSFFVLFVFTDYTNITAVKYNTFAVLGVIFSAYYIFEKGGVALTTDNNRLRPKRYPLPYIFLSAYLFFCMIAALFSPYSSYVNSNKTSVLIFGSGRYDGLLTVLMFALLFLFFSFEGTFSKIHINTVAITTFLMVLLGFLQLFGLNPFEFYPSGNFYTNGSAFVSTLGNIDIMSTYLCIVFALLGFAYIALESKAVLKAAWLVTYLLSVVYLYEINVDAGKLTVVLLLAVAVPVLAFKKNYFVKALDVLAVTIAAFALSGALGFATDDSGKEVAFEPDFSKMFFVLIAVSAVIIALRFVIAKFLNEKYMKICGIAIILIEVIALVAGVIFLKTYDGFEKGFLYQLSQILNGNGKDSYGSNRYGLWKYTLQLIKERFFIGFGSGTYRIGFTEFIKEAAPQFGSATYDFAHNEYLQVLYNCGIFGFVSYLGFIGWIVVKSAKNLFKNPKILVLGFAVLSYCIQAFFTFSIVFISPLFWVLLGMLCFEAKKSLNE